MTPDGGGGREEGGGRCPGPTAMEVVVVGCGGGETTRGARVVACTTSPSACARARAWAWGPTDWSLQHPPTSFRVTTDKHKHQPTNGQWSGALVVMLCGWPVPNVQRSTERRQVREGVPGALHYGHGKGQRGAAGLENRSGQQKDAVSIRGTPPHQISVAVTAVSNQQSTRGALGPLTVVHARNNSVMDVLTHETRGAPCVERDPLGPPVQPRHAPCNNLPRAWVGCVRVCGRRGKGCSVRAGERQCARRLDIGKGESRGYCMSRRVCTLRHGEGDGGWGMHGSRGCSGGSPALRARQIKGTYPSFRNGGIPLESHSVQASPLPP